MEPPGCGILVPVGPLKPLFGLRVLWALKSISLQVLHISLLA